MDKYKLKSCRVTPMEAICEWDFVKLGFRVGN